MNGLTPDGRALMHLSREEAQQYEQMFGIRIPGKTLADRISMKCQMKTIYSAYRPYGSSIIFASHDMVNGATLHMVEPSGTCHQYYGCASGRGKQIVRNEIERGNFKEKTVQEALPMLAKILLKAQDEMKEKKQELELSMMSEETKWAHKILDRQTTDNLTAAAQQEIENEGENMN